MYVQREKSRQKVRETRGKGSDFLHNIYWEYSLWGLHEVLWEDIKLLFLGCIDILLKKNIVPSVSPNN